MKFLISLATILFVSCCNDNESIRNNLPKHDHFFDEYIRSIEFYFKEITGQEYNFNIPISFNKLQANINGLCYYYENNADNYIEINKNNFIAIDGSIKNEELEQVLLHELGHCFFHREHDLTILKEDSIHRWEDLPALDLRIIDNRQGYSQLLFQKSLMWPIFISNIIYNENKNYFIREITDKNFKKNDILDKIEYNDIDEIPKGSYNVEYSVFDSTNKLILNTTSYNKFLNVLYGVSLPMAMTEVTDIIHYDKCIVRRKDN